jgi:DNA primase
MIMPYESKHRASDNLKKRITDVDFPALVAETHSIVFGKARCPFHDDPTPSCHIYDDHFFCFACGAHGDALTWLEQVQNLSKAEAIKELERRSGVGASIVSSKSIPSQKPRAIGDSQSLPENVVDLHLKRASRLERIPLALEDRGFTLEDLHLHWIASENEDALIPIFNPDGYMVAIKRRKHILNPKEQRYIYLTAKCGAPAWCSSNFSNYDTVLVIEGELNATICAAVHPEMAYIGVAGTENHLWLDVLKAKTVYIYADGDASGQKARERWALAAHNVGAKSVMILAPWEMDACDIAGKLGRDALRERLL